MLALFEGSYLRLAQMVFLISAVSALGQVSNPQSELPKRALCEGGVV